MAWVVGEISVGPPLGVDPVGQTRLRIQNKQTNKEHRVFPKIFDANSSVQKSNLNNMLPRKARFQIRQYLKVVIVIILV